jgi:hypothetical protein
MSGNGSFERGWLEAIRLWKSGVTFESITHRADRKSESGAYAFSRGMVASVEAMNGWLDLARRDAKAHGMSSTTTEELIRIAKSA